MTRPRCAGAALTGRDLWCSDDPFERAAAAEVCRGCEVRASCLAGARARGETQFVWGGVDLGDVGLAESEWVLPPVEAPRHGSRSAYLHCADGVDGGKCAACRGANAAYQAGYRDHGPTVTRPATLDLFEQLTIGAMA